MHDRRPLSADASLLAVAALWGFGFVPMKEALSGGMTPMMHLLVRQLIAVAVVGAIALFSVKRQSIGRRELRTGLVLGALLVAGWVAQTVGLAYTTPAKSGFITGLNVAIVPFVFWLVARHTPGRLQIAGAFIAAAGLAVLSLRGDLTLSGGDLLTLLGSVLFACQIVGLGLAARRMPAVVLALTQLVVAAALIVVVTPFVDPLRLPHAWQPWAATAWLGFTSVGLCFIVQAWAQRHTTSSHAAVILCFQGAFAGLFSVLLWGEQLTLRLVLGALLILAGVVISEVRTVAPAATS